MNIGSFGSIDFGEKNIYIAAFSYEGELFVSPPFFVLIPHDDGNVADWDGMLKSLRRSAKAYTRNGFLLERGRYPWGNEDRVFVYSETVYRSLESFRVAQDIEGFYAYCEQCDLVSFAGDSQ